MKTLVKQPSFPAFRNLMEDFWDNTNNLFNGGSTLPAVNIKESEKNFEIEVAAPGFEKQDFKIEVDKGVLFISAESTKEEEEKKSNYTRQEFSYSSFSRTYSLPQQVNEENIKAKYDSGVLHINLEKTQTSAPPKKTVEIE